MKSEQEEFHETSLGDVKKEMAMPRMPDPRGTQCASRIEGPINP